jgi:hypothetical protein
MKIRRRKDMQLVSSLDFLNHYIGIDEEKAKAYIKQGRVKQLLRIAARLYKRHHRRRVP